MTAAFIKSLEEAARALLDEVRGAGASSTRDLRTVVVGAIPERLYEGGTIAGDDLIKTCVAVATAAFKLDVGAGAGVVAPNEDLLLSFLGEQSDAVRSAFLRLTEWPSPDAQRKQVVLRDADEPLQELENFNVNLSRFRSAALADAAIRAIVEAPGGDPAGPTVDGISAVFRPVVERARTLRDGRACHGALATLRASSLIKTLRTEPTPFRRSWPRDDCKSWLLLHLRGSAQRGHCVPCSTVLQWAWWVGAEVRRSASAQEGAERLTWDAAATAVSTGAEKIRPPPVGADSEARRLFEELRSAVRRLESLNSASAIEFVVGALSRFAESSARTNSGSDPVALLRSAVDALRRRPGD